MTTDLDRLRAMSAEALCPLCSRVTERDGSCLDCGMTAQALADYAKRRDELDAASASRQIESAGPRRDDPVHADPPESVLLAEIRLALGKDPRCVIWRNNSGKFLADFGAKGKRPVTTGLIKGASDLIGLVRLDDTVCIMEREVDAGIVVNGMRATTTESLPMPARFLALECKTPTGRIRPEQVQFIRLVNSMGGYGCVVRSVADAMNAVDLAAAGEPAPEIGGE